MSYFQRVMESCNFDRLLGHFQDDKSLENYACYYSAVVWADSAKRPPVLYCSPLALIAFLGRWYLVGGSELAIPSFSSRTRSIEAKVALMEGEVNGDRQDERTTREFLVGRSAGHSWNVPQLYYMIWRPCPSYSVVSLFDFGLNYSNCLRHEMSDIRARLRHPHSRCNNFFSNIN